MSNLVFIMKKAVFCAVGTKILYKIKYFKEVKAL